MKYAENDMETRVLTKSIRFRMLEGQVQVWFAKIVRIATVGFVQSESMKVLLGEVKSIQLYLMYLYLNVLYYFQSPNKDHKACISCDDVWLSADLLLRNVLIWL
mgnify:FL=1